MSRRAVGAAGALSLLYGSALVFLRGRPSLDADAGIFVSIAARLDRGDSLYVQVWDNKPPLLYYSQALATEVAGWRGPFLLDALWLALACFGSWLLLRRVAVSARNRLIGAGLYPLLLSGAWYYAGYAELPALALAPLVAWLCLRRNPLAAGAVLGAVAFLRPDYGLIMLALVGVALGIANGGRDLPGQVARLLAGVAGAAASLVGVLALRGELSAYVDTVRSQFGYPDRALTQLGEQPGPVGHVRLGLSVISEDPLRAVLLALVAVMATALLVALWRRRTRSWRALPSDRLAAFLAATAVAVAATLALTELWDHGLEPIALPGTFAACFLVARLEAASLSPRRLLAATAATVVACAFAFGGLSVRGPGPAAGGPLSAWWQAPVSATALALDEAASTGRAGELTYARLGLNDDDGHAAFVDSDLALVCPIFHQYGFSTNLDEALACIGEESPDLVVVGSGFAPEGRSVSRQWDAFVADSRRLLRSRYGLAVLRRDRRGPIEVWSRTAPNER